MYRLLRHLCHFRKCSVTRPISAQRRRAARPARCISSAMLKRREMLPKRSSQRLKELAAKDLKFEIQNFELRRRDEQREIRSEQAAREHRDYRSRGSWEDNLDGGDNEGIAEAQSEDLISVVRFN